MNGESFQNVKDQIGFCGIWCGSCVVGNGALREMTKKYEQMIKRHGLPEWGPREVDFGEFTSALTSIQSMPSCQGCRKGDGRPNCEMRACASEKKIEDCSECEQIESCKHREALQKMRAGALAAGLMVKTQRADTRNLLRRWTIELKTRWPSSILFLPDR